MATSGQKPWPSAGSFVAAYGQFFMAADALKCAGVKGHRDLPTGGQEICPLVATSLARWWPRYCPPGLPRGWRLLIM